jgi:hypothetical protein
VVLAPSGIADEREEVRNGQLADFVAFLTEQPRRARPGLLGVRLAAGGTLPDELVEAGKGVKAELGAEVRTLESGVGFRVIDTSDGPPPSPADEPEPTRRWRGGCRRPWCRRRW